METGAPHRQPHPQGLCRVWPTPTWLGPGSIQQGPGSPQDLMLKTSLRDAHLCQSIIE